MRAILALGLLMLATSLSAAQKERVCKGKFSFELSDGTTGCVIGMGTAQISKGITYEGASHLNSGSSFDAAGVALAMFGVPLKDRRESVLRYKALCKTLLPVISNEHEKGSYQHITIDLHWPENPEVLRQGYVWDVQILQSAFMSPSCRSVRYYSSPRR